MKERDVKLAGLKEHQARAKESAAAAGRVRAALVEQNTRLSQREEIEKRLARLNEQREDMVADLAMGGGNQVDLGKISEEIAALGSEAAVLDASDEIVAGLRRKLNQAEDEHRGNENKAKAALRDYLLAEAEEVGAEYLAAARRVVSLYRRLQAINSFIEPMGYPISYGAGQNQRLSLPSFQLECHGGAKAGGSEYLLADGVEVSGNHYGWLRNDDIDAERQRMTGLGVVFD